jgi:hypothetical protein
MIALSDSGKDSGPVSAGKDATVARLDRFVRASLWSTLSLGSTFGAYNLLVKHLFLGPLPAAHHWSHGAFQLLGFVLFFLMGITYTAVPRHLGIPLPLPRLADATYWMGVLGLGIHLVGHTHAAPVARLSGIALGSVLQASAIIGWALVLFECRRRAVAGPERTGATMFAGSAVCWWLVVAVFLIMGARTAVATGDADDAALWNEPYYVAALFSGSLGWWAAALLVMRADRGQELPSPASRFFVCTMLQVGTAAAVLGAVRIGEPGSASISAVGMVLASLPLLVWAWAQPLPEPGGGWLRVSILTGFLCPVFALQAGVMSLRGVPPPQLIFDGARHAVTLGILTPSLFVMARQLLPGLRGKPLPRPHWPVPGLWLLLLGLLMREMQVLAVSVPQPKLLAISACSGLVAALGVGLLAADLFHTVRTR